MERNRDDEICSLLERHDERGLELLFAIYYRPLVIWADTFLQDITQAEDLVQEFFVKLWERRGGGQLQATTLKSYIFTSVKNLALNILEKKDPLKHAQALTRLDRASPEYDDLTEQMLKEVESEIEQLPVRSKEIIKAVYIEGLRYKEVAERYAISVSTVKTLLVKTLKKLREKGKHIRNKLILLFHALVRRRGSLRRGTPHTPPPRTPDDRPS
jgi:RNA polymerase sigma-70 factor (ECF subfamily)